MEELIEKLMQTVGLDKGTAEKVADFIKDHADDIPEWVAKADLKDKLPGGLGGLF
jgi:ABC-type proline/glycine betaine transport system substrate-binding protein